MNALIVAPNSPYPINGGNRVALHGYIVAMREAGIANIDLLCFDAAGPNDVFRKAVAVAKPSKYKLTLPLALLSGRSALVERYRSSAFSSALQKMLQAADYTHVLVQHAYMAQYVPIIRRAIPAAKIVASAEVLEGRAMAKRASLLRAGLLRPIMQTEARRLESEELRLLGAADTVAFFSQEDLDFYARSGQRNGLRVPLGLDLDRYEVVAPVVEPVPTVSFFGAFSWYANADALSYLLNDLWPEVCKLDDSVRLLVAGRGMPQWVSDFASPRVEVLGEVPDIRAVIARSDAVLSPVRIGGGVRLKMLESLAWGRPVISTSTGVEGLDDELRSGVLIADSAVEFVERFAQIKDMKASGLLHDVISVVRKRYDARSLSALFR